MPKPTENQDEIAAARAILADPETPDSLREICERFLEARI